MALDTMYLVATRIMETALSPYVRNLMLRFAGILIIIAVFVVDGKRNAKLSQLPTNSTILKEKPNECLCCKPSSHHRSGSLCRTTRHSAQNVSYSAGSGSDTTCRKRPVL